MAWKDVVLCSVFALCLPLGQIMFKSAALAGQNAEKSFLLGAVTNPWLYAAFGTYAMTALLWYRILVSVPLTQAYVFSIAGSVLVPLAAWAVFGEGLSVRYAVGCTVMLVGFYIAITGTP
jgi:drug/metabolite transporter (DMT)-like permease